MIHLDDEQAGVLAAIGAAVLFGASYPITAIALRSFGPIGAAGLQATIGLVAIGGLMAIGVLDRPSIRPVDPARLARLAALGLIGGTGFIVGMNLAVARSGPTITGFVAPAYAVLATLFAVPVLGERLRPSTLAAFGLALAGVVLLAPIDAGATQLSGVLWALGAAASFGLYLVLARRWTGRYRLGGGLIVAANLVGRGPLLLLLALAVEPRPLVPANPDPAAVAALVFLGLGASGLANLLVLVSVRRVPARKTSASLLLTPVASAAIGVGFLGDRLDARGLLGAALIVLAMAAASGVFSRPARRAVARDSR